MFRAGDDLFLHLRIQLYKIAAVASDSYYQFPVILRAFPGRDQSILIHNIELDMLSSMGQISSDHARQFVKILVCLNSRRMEFHVQQSSLPSVLSHL